MNSINVEKVVGGVRARNGVIMNSAENTVGGHAGETGIDGVVLLLVKEDVRNGVRKDLSKRGFRIGL